MEQTLLQWKLQFSIVRMKVREVREQNIHELKRRMVREVREQNIHELKRWRT